MFRLGRSKEGTFARPCYSFLKWTFIPAPFYVSDSTFLPNQVPPVFPSLPSCTVSCHASALGGALVLGVAGPIAVRRASTEIDDVLLKSRELHEATPF